MKSNLKELLLRHPLARAHLRGKWWRYLAIIGPGIIVANAGNDAGGIFTYSNIGAKYGYSLLWLLIPITISLIVVQEMAARMGVITGKGLMDLIRERFGVRWATFAALVVLLANGGTVLAEFAGIAGALELLGVARIISVPVAAVLLAVVVLRGNRKVVERIFLALGLTFAAYIATAFLVKPNWGQIGTSLITPNLGSGNVGISNYLVDIIALVGTSITPYMQLFLQSSVVDKRTTEEDLNYVRADVITGSIFADTIAAFIIIASGATLFIHGFAGVGINSAHDAAQALAPLTGPNATTLFAIGLLGASLLAAAVLPLSTAFVICEAFGVERSVQNKFSQAPLFFTIFLGILALGATIMLIPGVPIAGVAIGTQVLDGSLLPIILIFMVILINDKHIMGRFRNGPIFNVVAIVTAACLSLLALAAAFTSLFHP